MKKLAKSGKNANLKKSRKEVRKQQRKEKKARKNEYYTNRKKAGKYVLNPNKNLKTTTVDTKRNDLPTQKKVINEVRKEKQQHEKLQKQMKKQRAKQLKQANLEEDRVIKQLEKQLKLNKRKTKSVAKSFASDGLDYLLEICDSENATDAINAEQQLVEANEDFEEDFELMMGNTEHNSDENNEPSDVTDSEDNLESGSDLESPADQKQDDSDVKNNKSNSKKRKIDDDTVGAKSKKMKAQKDNDASDILSNDDNDSDLLSNDDIMSEEDEEKHRETKHGEWQDIYGRLRDKDGTVIQETNKKYIPPAIRAKLEGSLNEDNKRTEQLSRLKKQLKGLINRLAETNMHSIATQIEELYMTNSRNDMNETLTNLILESLVSSVVTPERLLLEHVMLITILHANVGTEVGAHFLLVIVKKFNELFISSQRMDSKCLDNVVLILSQLYNFKVYHSQLLFHVMEKLTEKFEEKDVECLLHVLKSVGFTLRKDDPIALKNLILSIQKQAACVSEETKRDNSRVKFMLDVLLAIKNNNVSKIPNYDTTYSEHLKKLLKGFVRKGNYVTQLNISLEDLLKAEENGKWWVVGSAWSGNISENNSQNKKTFKSEGYSQKLLELASKQRMNTDTRRSIFCIIMSAEDYLDAFEKLLRLGLKNQQEREIIQVILHCCLHEKQFNPYYAVLAQKFCELDRKYQMTIKCSVWDKLKTLESCSGNQVANLAKLLTHLFIEKALPISTLKIVQFSELDKLSLRFIRQILLGILLHQDTETCLAVFEKVAISTKLKTFRDSLRLFIHHFLLKNLKEGTVPEEQKNKLETRAQMVEKLLNKKESKLRY